MYRIIDGKGTGKTSRLFLIAKEEDATVVCFDPDVLREKAYRHGIVGLDFVSFYDFTHKPEEYVNKKVVIDELEKFIQYIIIQQSNTLECTKLIGYTLSNEG